MPTPDTSVDSEEVAKFEGMAERWWDPSGPMAPLHGMMPCRLDYIVSQVAAEFGRNRRDATPFAGLRIIDVGCGAGLLSEPMARLGAQVTGIDAAADAVRAGQAHAERAGLDIDYRNATAETLADEETAFDVVLAMEIVEHVADLDLFVRSCACLVAPGGLMIVSTLNRTAKSFALAIVGAEYIMGWLPKGTHDWSRFVPPDTLVSALSATSLDVVDRKGMIYDPIRDAWRLSDRDLSVNYIVTARKPAG